MKQMRTAVSAGTRATLGIVRGGTLQGGVERQRDGSGGEQPTLGGNMCAAQLILMTPLTILALSLTQASRASWTLGNSNMLVTIFLIGTRPSAIASIAIG